MKNKAIKHIIIEFEDGSKQILEGKENIRWWNFFIKYLCDLVYSNNKKMEWDLLKWKQYE